MNRINTVPFQKNGPDEIPLYIRRYADELPLQGPGTEELDVQGRETN